jgi:hypothetical protein
MGGTIAVLTEMRGLSIHCGLDCSGEWCRDLGLGRLPTTTQPVEKFSSVWGSIRPLETKES